MAKKIRIVFIVLLISFILCIWVGTSFSKYTTKIEISSFSFNIKANTKYTLSFDLNHNSGVSAPSVQTSNSSSFIIPDVVPTHKWGEFLGWTPDENVDHKGYPYLEEYKEGLLQPGDTFTGSGGDSINNIVNYTLYAVWYLQETSQANFEEVVEAANGDEVIIGGGDWALIDSYEGWVDFNPDTSKRLNLTIWDGNFSGWLMYITNADVVINGGYFPALDCFFMEGDTTITINGGDWSKISSFTFTVDDNAKITGGTFGFDVTEWVRTEGYTCVDNGNGTWTVQPIS